MDRAEHMRWCKERALAYVDQGDLVGAFSSMASDLRKHPETNSPAAEGVRCVQANDDRGMRRFIEGFAE